MKFHGFFVWVDLILNNFLNFGSQYGLPKTKHSTARHIGNATKKSTTECCFIKTVERHTEAQNNTIKVLKIQLTDFSLSHAEAIPIDTATCREGQTPVLVSAL